jgi:methyl-accepting chemotaxis protein
MAKEVRADAEGGKLAMTRMGEAIGRIKQSADQTAGILKTIDEIAFQTNLLALNAAVEAARAGDAGKGFAVVAEEVRSLARRSAEAAKKTAALIDESQKNAQEGITVSSEADRALARIAEKVQGLARLIGEVSAASVEQSKGLAQIGNAMTRMDGVTQANAAASEESASASEELFAQAQELEGMVEALVGIVQGAGSKGVGAKGAGASQDAPAGPRSGGPEIPSGADWSPRPRQSAAART